MLKRNLVLFIYCCVFGFTFASVANATLVGHWQFNGNAVDSSGRGHTGILNGDAIYIETEFSQKALYLDGNGDYVTIPDHSDFDFTDAYTLSLWLKPESLDEYMTLISKWVYHGGSQMSMVMLN